jgi:hypothetical protein
MMVPSHNGSLRTSRVGSRRWNRFECTLAAQASLFPKQAAKGVSTQFMTEPPDV